MTAGIRKMAKTLCWTMAVVGVWTVQANAGAWTAKQGGMYNKLSYNSVEADEMFDTDGDRVDSSANGEFSEWNLTYYMEYGITDSLTMNVSVPFKDLDYEDDNTHVTNDGIGDIDLGLKYKLYDGDKGIFSVQGLVKVPETYDEDDQMPLGNGQYDYEFRLLYGKSLWPNFPGYCNFEAAYRFRAEEPADEFRYLVEVGADFNQKIYGNLKLDGIIGMGNSDEVTDQSGNPTASLDYDLIKLYLNLGYKISGNWATEVGWVPCLDGENTSATDTYSVSLIYHF